MKRGGYLNIVQKTLPCLCKGSAIPPFIEVDVSRLDLGDRILVSQLSILEGVTCVVKVSTKYNQPCSGVLAVALVLYMRTHLQFLLLLVAGPNCASLQASG